MNEKKYEFTNETKMLFGIKLIRIKRISTNELGGFIEKESNLSQTGNACVFGDA